VDPLFSFPRGQALVPWTSPLVKPLEPSPLVLFKSRRQRQLFLLPCISSSHDPPPFYASEVRAFPLPNFCRTRPFCSARNVRSGSPLFSVVLSLRRVLDKHFCPAMSGVIARVSFFDIFQFTFWPLSYVYGRKSLLLLQALVSCHHEFFISPMESGFTLKIFFIFLSLLKPSPDFFSYCLAL